MVRVISWSSQTVSLTRLGIYIQVTGPGLRRLKKWISDGSLSQASSRGNKGIVERSHTNISMIFLLEGVLPVECQQWTLEPLSHPPLFLANQFGIVFELAEGAAPAAVPAPYADMKQDGCWCQQHGWSWCEGSQSLLLGHLSSYWFSRRDYSPFLDCELLGVLHNFHSQTLPWGPHFSLAPFRDFGSAVVWCNKLGALGTHLMFHVFLRNHERVDPLAERPMSTSSWAPFYGIKFPVHSCCWQVCMKGTAGMGAPAHLHR